MAGAFLTDTLREQAAAEMQGRMLQSQIARQVARQIVGNVAQQGVAQSMQRMGARTQALSRAADRTSQRDVQKTQLEMKKDMAEKQKTLGLITAAASAAGTLGAHLALRDPSVPDGPTNEDVRAAHSPVDQFRLPTGRTIGEIAAREQQLGSEYAQDLAEREELLKNVSAGAKTDALMYGGVPNAAGQLVSAPGGTSAPIDPYEELTDEEFQQSLMDF